MGRLNDGRGWPDFCGRRTGYALSDSRILRLNPYYPHDNIAPLLLNNLLETGSSSYSFTGSGTITFSGNAEAEWEKSVTGSGQITFSGAAATSKGFKYTGSGQVSYSGTAYTLLGYRYYSSGNIAFSGTAPSSFIVTKSYVGSGFILLDGSAQTSFDTVVLKQLIVVEAGVTIGLREFNSSDAVRAIIDGIVYSGVVQPATDDSAGGIRVKVNGVVKSLKRGNGG